MIALPKVTLNTTMDEGYGFGCGCHNPIGLKLVFRHEEDTIRTEFTPDVTHQGWPGLLHGGILGCLLDEAMSNAAYATGSTCLTASMSIRIRQPIKVLVPLVITARITRRRKMIIETAGEVRLKDGTLVAEATAKQFIANSEASKVKELRRHV